MIKYFSGTKYFCAAADLKWRDQSGGGLASVLGARLLARARRTHVPGTSIVIHVALARVGHVALARAGHVSHAILRHACHVSVLRDGLLAWD